MNSFLCLSFIVFLFSSFNEANFEGRDTDKSRVTFADKIVANSFVSSNDFMFENESTNNTYRNNKINIVLKYNHDSSDCFTVGTHDENEDIESKREKLHDFYTTKNENLVERLNFKNMMSVYRSAYGPYISYSYSTLYDFIKSDYQKLKANDSPNLLQVFIEKSEYGADSAYRINPENSGVYPYARALGDVGLKPFSKYKGLGVKIGILDSKLPNSQINLSGITYYEYGSSRGPHAFQVSSLLGGTYGIASSATLYFASKNDHDRFDCIDWMISNGVNVINHSSGYVYDDGIYNASTSYVDYIVQAANVTFVNAIGNDGVSSNIASPATGLNVIAVGSSNRSGSPSYFNSVGIDPEYNAIIKKPTLLAPGNSLMGVINVCDGTTEDDLITGTSFSTPIVTGIIALLMEEFPDLKTRPHEVMALLACSCELANGQTNTANSSAGFGIVNYENARNAYVHTESLEIYSDYNSNVLFESSIFLDEGETIDASSFSLLNAPQSQPIIYVDPDSLTYSLIRIELDDEDYQNVAQSSTYGNYAYMSYTNEYSAASFHITVSLDGSAMQSSIEKVGFAYSLSNEKFASSLNISGAYALDSNPTFCWELLLRRYVFSDETVDFYIVNFRCQIILEKKNLSSLTSYTLTKSEWSSVIDLRGREFYCYIVHHQRNSYANVSYSSISNFYEPQDYSIFTQIKPADWGFEPQYYFGVQQEEPLIRGALEITTTRLRCGYIENQYINLSAKRQGAGIAYFEMQFNIPVYSYMFGVTLWSGTEGLYWQLGHSAIVETMGADREWNEIEDYDILRDNTPSEDRTHVDRYDFHKPQGIYGIRFYSTCDAVGTRNKGRVCIDDIVLSTDPNNTSFYSRFYESIV